MTDLRKLLEAATKGPWDYDTTMTEGEYGDGGPDSHVGFKQFVIVNENGDTICDTTNRDGSLVEVVEHLDEDGWDARDVLGEHDAALIVAAVNALPAMLDIVEALERDAQDATRYRWLLDTFFSDSNASHLIGRCNTPAELDAAIDRAIKDRT